MDDKDEKSSSPYYDINKVVGDALKQKSQNDQRIKSLQGKGPEPRPKGPIGGFDRNRSYEIRQLQHSSKDINANTLNKVNDLSKGMSRDGRKEVGDKVTTKLYPQQSQQERANEGKRHKDIGDAQEHMMGKKADHIRDRTTSRYEQRGQQKDLDASQKFMNGLRSDFKQGKQPQPPDKQNKSMDASQRFMNSMRSDFKNGKTVEPSKGQDIDKDPTDPSKGGQAKVPAGKENTGGKDAGNSGKSFSMSDRFTQSLNSGKSSPGNGKSSPSKSSPAKSSPSGPSKE